MNIAIFHNFMDNIGGAEIVTLTLARELNADVYTTNINHDHIKEMGFEDIIPRIFSIGKIPLQAPFRQQTALWRFRHLNLAKSRPDKKYDFHIISGDWAMSGGVNNSPNLWYAHSPLHELWEFKDWIKKTVVPLWKRPAYDLWVYLNRKLTLRYSKKINTIVTNSSSTRDRVKKYYNRDSTVIYPPIYTSHYKNKDSKGYWLSVNRLFRNKRVEIQLEAFRKIPDEKLIVVGSYEKSALQFESYKKELDLLKPENVKILNWVPNTELVNLYSECKGFITTSMKEDFGMTAVEALASGKPVIAPNEGGYKESIIDNQNGILIDDIDSNKLVLAIDQINNRLSTENNIKHNCISRASEFDTNVFITKIKDIINKKIR